MRRLAGIGSYVAATLALVVFWGLQQRGLLAATPFWLLLAFLAIACAGDALARLTQRRWPESSGWDHVRVTIAAATTTLVLYATGWGSMLTVGFAVGATQVLGQSARPDWRWTYACNLVAIAGGEIAIQVGVAPSLIHVPLAHAVAFVGALCLGVVLWILGEAVESATTNQRLVLEREASLLRQATHDPLTGLPNRTLFNDRLAHALTRRSRIGGYVAVMVVDLDGFKNVNDSLGHPTGDALLIAVADRFNEHLRDFDTIARVGGDEFAILVDDLDAPDQAGGVAQRVLDALLDPVELGDRTVTISASIGIEIDDRTDVQADELFAHADAAMYQAKREGKGCYRVFEAAMHTASVERMNLEQGLRAALVHGALTVHYQPIIDTSTGHVTSFEALARWPHPTRGFIPPDTFIPIAEDSGVIIELGHAVLLEACERVRGWRARFPQFEPRISVNASRLELVQPGFTRAVAEALGGAGLDPAVLTLEVTESALADPGSVITTLDELRRTGIRIAIDDFGTGHSSFAALGELPIDILKVDKRFIDNIVRNEQGHGFVKAIMQLAQTLQLETVGEGVEQPEQAAALAELGCTRIQGYLYSPPMPGDEADVYLEHHRSRGAHAGRRVRYPHSRAWQPTRA